MAKRRIKKMCRSSKSKRQGKTECHGKSETVSDFAWMNICFVSPVICTSANAALCPPANGSGHRCPLTVFD
jgi:hypothetical protein